MGWHLSNKAAEAEAAAGEDVEAPQEDVADPPPQVQQVTLPRAEMGRARIAPENPTVTTVEPKITGHVNARA